ncbi:MAG: PilZ domain-containing protein [Candidatus Sumerlaeia bacterium]|nr:PilZ domain-containing protein [Candidatus Sumerlaeia bacterium]
MAPHAENRNRRRHARIAVSADMRYGVRESAHQTPPDLWEGTVVNISISGAAFKTSRKVAEGAHVEMVILQSNPVRCIQLLGTVKRCENLLEINAAEPDKSPSRCFLVAVEFAHLLSVEELAMLRGRLAMDATVAESSAAPSDESPSETVVLQENIISQFINRSFD